MQLLQVDGRLVPRCQHVTYLGNVAELYFCTAMLQGCTWRAWAPSSPTSSATLHLPSGTGCPRRRQAWDSRVSALACSHCKHLRPGPHNTLQAPWQHLCYA